MAHSNEKALQFVPVENGERRIDVSLNSDETVLKLSSWTDGLGWCVQKTMRIDADMLDDLHSSIEARIRIKNKIAEEGQHTVSKQKVLTFPIIG